MLKQERFMAKGQSMVERYGVTPWMPGETTDCTHANATLVFAHPALDEWYCWDCQRRVKVWSNSP